jgi:hypothetical protein
MKFNLSELKNDTSIPRAAKMPTQFLVLNNNFGILQKSKKKGYTIVNRINPKNLLFLNIIQRIARRAIKIKNLYLNSQEKLGKYFWMI